MLHLRCDAASPINLDKNQPLFREYQIMREKSRKDSANIIFLIAYHADI